MMIAPVQSLTRWLATHPLTPSDALKERIRLFVADTFAYGSLIIPCTILSLWSFSIITYSAPAILISCVAISVLCLIINSIVSPDIAPGTVQKVAGTFFINSFGRFNSEPQIPKELRSINIEIKLDAWKDLKLSTWEGKPIGLNNPGCNCCFNAMVQEITAFPVLAQGFYSYLASLKQGYELLLKKYQTEKNEACITGCETIVKDCNKAIIAYRSLLEERAQALNDPEITVSTCDTSAFRVLLAHITSDPDLQSTSNSVQLDTWQLKQAFLGHLPASGSIQEKIYLNPTPLETPCAATDPSLISTDASGCFINRSAEPTSDLRLPFDWIKDAHQTSFKTLILKFFKEFAKSDDGELAARDSTGVHFFKRRFATKALVEPPPYLFLLFNRLVSAVQDVSGAQKQSSLIYHIPQSWTLTKKQAGSDALYELRSFTIHHGKDVASGHYTACSKQGNTWYECDDSHTRKLSEAELNVILAKHTTYDHLYVKAELKPEALEPIALEPQAMEGGA